MQNIECRTIPQDGYPAGLLLAGALWAAIEKNKGSEIRVKCISRFWDGVKIEGLYRGRLFWVETNYATEAIVLLSIHLKRRVLEPAKLRGQLEMELKLILEQYISAMEGRKENQNP